MDLAMSSLRERISPSQRDGFPVMKGALPGLGHLPQLHTDAVRVLRRAADELGPLVQVDVGFGQWHLMVFGADSFELFKHKAVSVASGARENLDYLVGGTLVTTEGPVHRHIRSAMNPTFSPRGLSESTAAQVCLETVQRHAREFVAAGGGDVHAHMQKMALDVIFRIVGVDTLELEEWRKQYRKTLLGFIPFPYKGVGSPQYFGKQAVSWVDEALLRLVQRAREEEGTSMLHALVKAKDEEGNPLSDGELTRNLRLLFFAGHETTATTLTFGLMQLTQRPDLIRRIKDEVAAAGGPPLTLADAKKLPVCEGVFREAVRLYGPAWMISRGIVEDVSWHGRTIPAGTRIALAALLWGRDEEAYPDAERFDPDRWIGKTSAPTPYELAQFAGGPHFCLGYHLTWLESVQYLAAFAHSLAKERKGLWLGTAKPPKVVYFPMPRPSPAAKVRIAES